MIQRFLALALVLMAALPAAASPSAVVTTPQVRAELLAHAPEGVQAGKTLQLGLFIRHQPEWHTYWRNPGDSGLPTTLDWKLPAGFAASEITWPTPKKLPVGPLMNYGYEGELLLPVTVQVPADFQGPALSVRLIAEWLVCKDVCIPESGEFALEVPAQAATAGDAARFAAARAAQPRELAATQGQAALEGSALVFRVEGLPAAWQGRAIELLPEEGGVIANAARQEARWDGVAWSSRVPVDPQRSAGPASMHAVLLVAGEKVGLRIPVQVTTPWPAVAVPSALPSTAAPAPSAQPAAQATSPIGLPLALAFALVGGLLLNLMPCVFPVLSLKVLGIAGRGRDRGTMLSGALAYTAGVVLSFVALAALLLALRAGGEQLGWGFQLQSPAVVATLALLFTLIGLNLAGVFEIGSVLPSSAATARARHPLVDQALTGVLAVAVASPCTAPFMGASLGLALTLPAAQALLLFAVLGLGMALPYLALALWPALAQKLPRPGPWMAHFKVVMAFPMFATVVWLTWVLGQQIGIDGAAALMAVLVAVAFAAWSLGSPSVTGRARLALGGVALITLAAALVWALPGFSSPSPQAQAEVNDWQPWSQQEVRRQLDQGRPVFVDFTAAWCVTCQYNKRTVLADSAVTAEFARRGVVRMRADWTRRDAAITAELAALGRSGVPVYALYAPGVAGPKLLSEILSVNEVREALAPLPAL